jgi:hypothetical protein
MPAAPRTWRLARARDISHSAAERVIAPDHDRFDFTLGRLARRGAEVHPK